MNNRKNFKEGEMTICPKCNGTGEVRDWVAAIFSLGMLSLADDDKDECPRCQGTGFIRIKSYK